MAKITITANLSYPEKLKVTAVLQYTYDGAEITFRDAILEGVYVSASGYVRYPEGCWGSVNKDFAERVVINFQKNEKSIQETSTT